MTLQALPLPLQYPGYLDSSINPGVSSTTIDAAGEYVATILNAPKSGNISEIGYFPATATGSPAVDVRVETAGADGLPSGTLWGANTNASHSPTSNTWAWVTLTAVAAVTKGQVICLKIAYSSGTSLQVRRSEVSTGVPYGVLNTGSPAKSASVPIILVKYDDGSIPFVGVLPLSNATVSQNITTATTPDEVGVKFSLPFVCKIIGAVVRVNAAAAAFDVKLYNAADTLQESASVDGDTQFAAGAGAAVLFDTEVSYSTTGQDWRLTILPTSGTVTVYRGEVNASATREAWPGGTAFQKTERTDAGAWTDTNTQVPFISLLISALDDGAGGGTSSPGSGLVGGRLTR